MRRHPFPRRAILNCAGRLAFLFAFGCAIDAGSMLRAEEPEAEAKERVAPPIDPRQFGLQLPNEGVVEPGKGRLVLAPDESDKPVVARLHCRVGDMSLVILPSGRLKSTPTSSTTITDRKFQPMASAELIKRLQGGVFKDFKSASSEHYSYLYACQDSFYQTTRDILDSLYGGVIESLTKWGLQVSAPEVPLVVLIFPDRASFDEYHKMPAEVAAYYDSLSNYVVLYQDPELSDAVPEFALKLAAYTIAHEGVHQILHNVGVQKRLAPWPMWLSEGLPELFCPMKVTSSMIKEGSDSMPKRSLRWTKVGMVNDLRMHDLLKLQPAGGELIETVVKARRLTALGYAVAWGLGHYLVGGKPKVFQTYLREVAETEPLADFGEKEKPGEDSSFSSAAKELFVKHFGGDFAKLEGSVAKHLNSESVQAAYHDPVLYQTHYIVVHTAMRGRNAQITVMITLSPDGARKWKADEMKNQDPGQKHGFRTEVCETRQKAEAALAKIGGRR